MSLRPLRADTEDDAAFAYARMAPAAGRWSESPIPRVGVRRIRQMGAASECVAYTTFVPFEIFGNYAPSVVWPTTDTDFYVTFAETPATDIVAVMYNPTLDEGVTVEDATESGGVWHFILGGRPFGTGTMSFLDVSADHELTILSLGTCPP